jgi:hypothetical protein
VLDIDLPGLDIDLPGLDGITAGRGCTIGCPGAGMPWNPQLRVVNDLMEA